MPERRTPLRRTGWVNPFGRKARREQEALQYFRIVVHARRWCEANVPGVCPPGLHDGHHAHHVWPEDRDAGLHNPARGLLVCAPAHSWIHTHPVAAAERGLLRPDRR